MEQTHCELCPRRCRVDRREHAGLCGGGSQVKVARAALHFWEEPCISGSRGSGTVFFSGCPLGCIFCQNRDISGGGVGQEVSVTRLGEIFLELQAQGAHNLNLVTPTHYTEEVLEALDTTRARRTVPVVMNSGGYERVETLRRWEGKADIYLPDLKYRDDELARRYSGAAGYFSAASAAILEMHRQQPCLEWDEAGVLRRGLVVRHLVLPGGWKDSLALLEWLDSALPKDSFLLSLMRQFTPTPACAQVPELNRRLTTFEYEKVAGRAREQGFAGYEQDAGSARETYTPPFDLTGVQSQNGGESNGTAGKN